MTSFPAVKGKDLISALRGAGFVVVRVKGSHHSSVTLTVAPQWFLFTQAKHLGPGCCSAILRDLKPTREQLQRLL